MSARQGPERHVGHSVLQVPVPALESFVRERVARYDAGYVSADPVFVHAHVTALGPFLPRLDEAAAAAVADVLASVEPFDFALRRVATFPNGIIHLLPEPDDGFRELTSRMWEAFPGCPPYAGEFDPVPHLTLDAVSAEVSEDSVRAALATPYGCRAERVDLAWWEPDNCHVMASWPLGRRRQNS